MIATNALPRFNDRTSGTWRRILLMPFERVVPEAQQVKGLATELKKELSGIFNWALQRLDNLNRNNGFAKPARHGELIDEYRKDSDPCRAFLLDNYAFFPNTYGLDTRAVYRAYTECGTATGCRAMNERTFGQQVQRVFPGVERKNRGPRGDRPQGLVFHIESETRRLVFAQGTLTSDGQNGGGDSTPKPPSPKVQQAIDFLHEQLAGAPLEMTPNVITDAEVAAVWDQARRRLQRTAAEAVIRNAERGSRSAGRYVENFLRSEQKGPGMSFDFERIPIEITTTILGKTRQTRWSWTRDSGCPRNPDCTYNVAKVFRWMQSLTALKQPSVDVAAQVRRAIRAELKPLVTGLMATSAGGHGGCTDDAIDRS